jgi:hypothetical protein
MEIILAIVVVVAVIFFGALISMGNERQCKAIDGLREQAVLWAIQDLRIKRERLAQNVRVDDPIGWFNQTATRVCGFDLKLQFQEAFDEPQGLKFTSEDGVSKVVFSPLSQMEITRLRSVRRGRLSQFPEQNPLLALPRGIKPIEISVLNCGILFDLELPLAWKGVAGQHLGQTDCIWMYKIS